MANLFFYAFWLAVCIWAAFFVSKRIEDSYHRVVYYLLIWLVPFLGAIAATLIAGLRSARKDIESSDKMFDAVIDGRRSSHD